MSFEIVITEKRQVKTVIRKSWEKVGEKEVEREVKFYSSRDETEPMTRIEAVYGYTPEVEGIVNETREVLKQSVDELDLPAVIRAINKL
jgi:hypothetical protein